MSGLRDSKCSTEWSPSGAIYTRLEIDGIEDRGLRARILDKLYRCMLSIQYILWKLFHGG